MRHRVIARDARIGRRRQHSTEPTNATTSETAEVVENDIGISKPADEGEDKSQEYERNKEVLARFIAKSFVRRDGKYFRVKKPEASLSAADVKRVCYNQAKVGFPHIEITDQLWSDVCQHAINDTHSDRESAIPVWDGTQSCRPDDETHLAWDEGIASLNTWRKPDFRALETTDADGALFEDLLRRIFRQEADRTVFKDWLAWNLQNEGDKPTWCLLLYSQSKGTGKSTLVRLLSLLFGTENSMPLNGVSKLTGRFNKSVMLQKFVTCEEVLLKPGTDAGNTIKALISEKEIAVEGKGTNTEYVKNVCAFLMTTNHFPHWIEPDDRRFYVIDVNHSGHAAGADREEFQAFMTVFHDYMARPENLAKLRNYLLAHQPSNGFNPRSLNVAAVDTPIMKTINEASGEVLQQQLEEIIAASGRFALPQADLIQLFSDKLKANSNRIVHMMSELGWRREKAKWGGTDYARRIWVHPDYQVSRGRVTGPNGYDEPVSKAEEVIDLI